ncbi:hypothetical protein SeMB42_g04919 [Synchytrium endobioticum]|uniref:LysM domain-containing protein n=1 Tax=Synchytrium endobioticum TaxID=286115 RepID=A0A507CV37_9FUNG|nr:hypothetical protein SeMB42_g04919 [Synchytrium endobioticum]
MHILSTALALCLISRSPSYALDATINPRCLAGQANLPPVANSSCGFKMIAQCLRSYTVPSTGTLCSDVVSANGLTSIDHIVGLNPGLDCQNILYEGEKVCISPPTSSSPIQIPPDCTERMIVQHGQTCVSIATTYLPDAGIPDLERLNPGLACAAGVPPGTLLCVARCTASATATAAPTIPPPQSPPAPDTAASTPTRAFTTQRASISTSTVASTPTRGPIGPAQQPNTVPSPRPAAPPGPAIQIPQDCQERYITQPADTCVSISAAFLHSDVQALVAMNGGLDCANMGENQVICIARCNTTGVIPTLGSSFATPSASSRTVVGTLAPFQYAASAKAAPTAACTKYYTITDQDTCASIAGHMCGHDVNRLLRLNPGLDCALPNVGQSICVSQK